MTALSRARAGHLSSGVPAPYPLLGHLPHMLRDPLNFFMQVGLGHDVGWYQSVRGPRPVVNQPELLRQIWQDARFERTPVSRKVLAWPAGPGLLSQEGAEHRRSRRLMQPAFHKERLGGYLEPMVRHTEAMLAGWSHGQRLDLVPEMKRLAIAIVGDALFSQERPQDLERITHAVEALLPKLDLDLFVYGALPPRTRIRASPRQRAAQHTIGEGLRWVIAARRALRSPGHDLLGMLLEARDEDGSHLSDAEIAAQALTLMSAGFETTANTLAWMWVLLGQHPQVLERLRAELWAVLGDGPITLERLPRLRYLDCVVKETQRLYPAAWASSRVPTETIVLGDTTFVAGRGIFMSAYLTHRDPRYFPEPERFWPERFEDEASIPRYAYLPFGAGVHQCIGNTFALWELKVILATVARRVRLVPPQDFVPRVRIAITLGLEALPITVQRLEPEERRAAS